MYTKILKLVEESENEVAQATDVNDDLVNFIGDIVKIDISYKNLKTSISSYRSNSVGWKAIKLSYKAFMKSWWQMIKDLKDLKNAVDNVSRL